MQGYRELKNDKLKLGIWLVSECPRAEQGKESMKYVGFRMYNCNSTKDNFCYICVVFQFCMVAGMQPEPASKKTSKIMHNSWLMG